MKIKNLRKAVSYYKECNAGGHCRKKGGSIMSFEYIFMYDKKNNLGIDADGNKYEVHKDKVVNISTREETPIDEMSLLEQLHPKARFDPERPDYIIQVAFVTENGQWGGIPTVKVPLDFEELDEFKITAEEVCAEYGWDTDSNNEEVFNTVGLTLKDTLVEYLSDQIYDKFYNEAQYWEFPIGVVDWDDMDADLDTLLIEYFTKYEKCF